MDELKPGVRVRITQTIDRWSGDWRCEVVGVIQAVEVGKTGSWYAHGKDDQFWLRRVRLRKDDGEITTVNLDQRTEIERVEDGAGRAADT